MAKNRQIEVSLDSGANCQSKNVERVDVADLGFETRADWDAATEEQKFEAVQGLFLENGYPEISWKD